MEKLWCRIETLRQTMYEIAMEKGISHSDALIASQKLDELINEFYNGVLIKKAG